MKARDIQIASIYANCAKCGESLVDSTGAEIIRVDAKEICKGLTCPNCGAANELPVWVIKASTQGMMNPER